MKLRALLAVLVCGAAALAADAGAELFQKAVTEERAAGNLEAAIKLYQRVAGEFASNRPLAAKALVQEARCYEKLGQDKAVKLYEQVAREFGDQPEQAAAARERLAAIAGGTVVKSGAAAARQIPIPASASWPTSDGRHVFYVDLAAGGLIAAGMDGSNLRVIYPLPADSHRIISTVPTVSPDGKQVAFHLATSDHSSYCVVGTDGSGFRELYRPPLPGVQVLGGWSPDGRSFIAHLLEPDGSYTLVTISAQDGSVRTIHNDPNVRGPVALLSGGGGFFSPDGKYIIFAVRPSAGLQSDIHIVAVDGSYQGRLVEHPSRNRALGFAPDGKHLLFYSDRSGKAGIYAVEVVAGRTQGEPVLIKQEPESPIGGSLTRNGAFFYGVGENPHANAEAFTLNLDPTTGMTAGTPQLLSGPAGFTPESAAWSPDGKKLAFISGRLHVHGGGDVMLTVRTLDSGRDAEWKMPPETGGVVGWATDGGGVYTTARYDSKVELRSVSPATGESKTVTVIPGSAYFYAVRSAPDGNTLLVSYGDTPSASVSHATVIRLDPRTGQHTEILAKGEASEVVFSTDGKQLGALNRQAKSASILVKPLEGGEWKPLATLEGTGYMFLYWMPNGDLLLGKEGRPDSSIYRLPAAGGTPRKIADLVSLEHVHEIRVHPDGRQLLFQSRVSRTEFWALENFLPKEMRGR